jgi:aryl-alcohol dehydrogenase-like predicted oxidoreductase
VRQGKVRYLGASNHPAWLLTKALWVSDRLGLARYDCLQPHYNLVHRAEFEQELMALCQDQGLGVIPYSPLQGGFLTGKYRKGKPMPEKARGATSNEMKSYMTDRNFALIDKMEGIGRAYNASVSQVAIAWLLANPAVTSPIIGANTVAQLTDTMGALSVKLSGEEFDILNQMSAWE